jgi:acyl-CoA synthetase (AMP-forming)/AMP-acid ligase II
MAVPPKPEDSRHHIRSMIGNGMRATIWKDFIERFKIKEMKEVYGITEGNVTVCKLFYSRNYKYQTYLNNMFLCYAIFWCIRLISHKKSCPHMPLLYAQTQWVLGHPIQ